MSQPTPAYALSKRVSTSYEETVQAVRDALGKQGFGVLTEIDVTATLKNKLNVDYPKTIILGACNPPLAHKAMLADPYVSVFLPCNVVVMEVDGGVEVAAINPQVMGDMIGNPGIVEVANVADQKLRAAFADLL